MSTQKFGINKVNKKAKKQRNEKGKKRKIMKNDVYKAFPEKFVISNYP